MRFVSKYGKYTRTVVPPKEQPMPNGRLYVENPGIQAEFRYGNISEREYEVALEAFNFQGELVELDGKTDVPVRFRIGVYDTDSEATTYGWDDELKAEVERLLLGFPEYGIDYMLVKEKPVPMPWPTYDKIKGAAAPNTIAKAIRDMGFDPVRVLEYERQNEAREDVINAIDALVEKPPATESNAGVVTVIA